MGNFCNLLSQHWSKTKSTVWTFSWHFMIRRTQPNYLWRRRTSSHASVQPSRNISEEAISFPPTLIGLKLFPEKWCLLFELHLSALSYKYTSVADNVGPNFKSKNMVKNWERVSSLKKIKTPSLLGIYSLVREAFSSFSRHTCKDARFQHEANWHLSGTGMFFSSICS